MSFWPAIFVLLVLGICHDALWTLYIRAVSLEQRMRASVVSGVLTAFGFLAWTIMVKTGFEATVAGICAYSVGAAVGTYLCFRKRAP